MDVEIQDFFFFDIVEIQDLFMQKKENKHVKQIGGPTKCFIKPDRLLPAVLVVIYNSTFL